MIVVPDGLAAAGQPARALPTPNFVYRAVLDHVAAAHSGATILLAPANDFGSGRTEQAAAAEYLRARGSFHLFVPDSPPNGYIDTRSNAHLLREYLERENSWPLPPAVLVTGTRHARRAALCFRREGFALLRVEAVAYRIPPDEKVVRSLWYYRYPIWHELYEAFAYIRDFLRRGFRTN